MISREGYRRGEENNPFKIVPGQPGRGTNISMLENDGSPLEKGPLFLQDNFGNFDIGIPGMQNINFTGDYVTETPINTRKAYDDLLKMLTHQGEKRKKVNAYGFLQGPKGNEPNIVGGAGIKFPGGFGIQGVGVLPTNNDPVFKGVGEAGINFDIGNLNLGANVGVPFLNDYNTGERLPFKPQPKLTAKFKFPTGGSVYDRYKFYKDKEGRSEEQSWWMAYNLPKAQDGNKGVVSDSTTLQMKDVRMQKMIAAIQAKIAAEEAAEAEKNKVVEAPVVEPVQVAPVQVAPIVNKPVVNPVVNKPVINKPVVNPVVNKPVIPPPVQTKPINIEDQKYPWFNKQIDFANPPTYDYQWNAGLENKDLELMPKGDNTRLFVSGVGYLGEHTPEVDPHYNPPSNNEKIANSYLDIELIDKKIQELTYISTNPKSGESIEQAKEEITQLNKKRNDNVQRINEAKKDEAGFFDSWVSEAWSPSLSKPLEKYGIIDQYSPAILNQPKFETYTEKVEKERKIEEVARETRITTNSHDEISPSNNKWHRWQYRTSASNDDPLTVQLYGTRGEREGKNLNIKSKGSIMHFLDQSPISGYMNRKTQVFYENAKPDDYFGYLRKNVDGTHNVLYLKRKDIPAGDLYQKTFLIRQNDFDDINFSGRATDANFAGHTYWTLKSTGKNAIPISAGKDRNTYDYSSGQSVVYIFPYKGETRYIHFAGSPNSIEKEGDKINKRYKLKKNVLKLGVADAGSYSSSVKGNITNNLLNSKDYGYYNMNSNTGAGMALIKKLGGELPKAQSGKFNLGVRPINLHLDKWDKQDSYFTATGAGAGLLASVPNLVKNYKVDQLSEYMCGPGYTCPSGIGKGNQDLFIDPANTQLGYNEPVEGNVGKAWGNLALNTALGGVTGWATSKLYDKIRGRKEGGSLPKAQFWNSAREVAKKGVRYFDDAAKYVVGGLKTTPSNLKMPTSTIAGQRFASADDLKAAFLKKNAADLSAAKLNYTPQSGLVESIEANIPSSAPFFSQLDYYGTQAIPEYKHLAKKGATYNYPKTINSLTEKYTQMPTLNSAGFPVYFHGTGSASLPGILKQQGLLNYGKLKNIGKPPMTGEMSGVSLGQGSINTEHLSATFIENLRTPIEYTGAFGKNQRNILGDYDEFLKNLRQYTNKHGTEKATRYKDLYTQRVDDYLKMSQSEQNLVKENFPVLFGVNPNKVTSLGKNRFSTNIERSDVSHELGIRGKLGWDEIAGMFVPKNKMGFAQDVVGSNIKVGNLDEIVKGTYQPYLAKGYKWKQGGSINVSAKQVHDAADKVGMKWDNDEAFMVFSEKITGKRHIDDMTSEEKTKLISAIKSRKYE